MATIVGGKKFMENFLLESKSFWNRKCIFKVIRLFYVNKISKSFKV